MVFGGAQCCLMGLLILHDCCCSELHCALHCALHG